VSRWLVLVAGLAFAIVVSWSLLTAPQSARRSGALSAATPRVAAAAPRVEVAADPEPDAHITKSSREALRDILRDADEEGSP
jgi:hypothetical protein